MVAEPQITVLKILREKKMTKDKQTVALDELEKTIIDLLSLLSAKYPKSSLSLLAGCLVGLAEELLKEQGNNPSLEIVIDAFSAGRKITIDKI